MTNDELNKAVADAIGLSVTWEQDERGNPCWWWEDPSEAWVPQSQWSPSTDWNDAMWAAEKVAHEGFAVHRPHDDEFAKDPETGWRCIIGVGWHDGQTQSTVIGDGPTGPTAICKAILNLKASG